MGADVTLLEAETIGHGGSGRNVGLVNAGLWLPPDEVCSKMGQAAGERLNETLAAGPDEVFDLIARYDIQCDAVRNGTLHLAHSEKGIARLKARLTQFERQGAPVTFFDKEETCRRTGSGIFHSALHDRRAGTIQPLSYAKGLARAAQAAGAMIHERSPVLDLYYLGGQWQARTEVGTISAKSLLLATNAYRANIETIDHPKTAIVQYFQIVTEPLSSRQLEHILPNREGAWDTALIMTSFRLDASGRLMVGGMGDGRALHQSWAKRKLAQIFPSLKGATVFHAWSGRISMTADHLPRIMRLAPNSYSIFGYSGRGICPGTVFGSAAALALLTDDPTILPVPVCENYSERVPCLKSVFYETSSSTVHLISAR
ncbi:Gamma-glutamylputrescine oxidoreductase [Roseovarius albus]|uniref:Gamma-glutamylputrescine oxidoreductase n=2 Tax=Roseovarius albus TaxID=1247867 RepID=A0A1X6YZQ1_9RHOB|nr:Gamma-glutamylputrescine oxidoreductase [Roseovarius albus]